MVTVLLPTKHAEKGFDALKVVILMWRTKIVLDGQKHLKTKIALVDEDPC